MFVIEENRLSFLWLTLLKDFQIFCFCQMQLFFSIPCCYCLRTVWQMYDKCAATLFLISFISTFGAFCCQNRLSFLHTGSIGRWNMTSIRNMVNGSVFLILLRLIMDIFSIILVSCIKAVSIRPEFYHPLCPVNGIRRIVCLIHWKNRSIFYKHRKFPKRRRKVIKHLSAQIFFSGQIIDPHFVWIWKVNVVSHIISLFICSCIFINWCN